VWRFQLLHQPFLKEIRNTTMKIEQTQEEIRLQEAQTHQVHWRRWGPYLSDRQWGTVREDYSRYGSAWDYFTHDQARSALLYRR
jgi:hypothetical protein